MTDTKILDKVRKLLKLAGNNPNQEEAALAAAKAQQLIDEYELSAALLALDGSPAAEPDEAIEDFGKKGAPLDSKGDRWRDRLAVVICRHNGCKPYKTGMALQIIGRPRDVDAVRYLYTYLAGQVEQLADRHGRGCGFTWRNNFRHGVVDTIARKLKAQHEAFTAQARATAGSSTALMRVDQALAVIERKTADVERWAATNMRLRKTSGGGFQGDRDARAQGRIAGESVRINSASAGIGSGAKRLGAAS